MRELGEARLRDGRVAWTDELPRHGAYDRVLCGAGIWQLGPLGPTIVRLASLVAPGGALCFSVPALYLGEPDDPGGGRDPLLLELPALVANGRTPQADPAEPLPAPDGVEALLAGAGLRPVRYALRRRVTQGELRDWLKIPVLTDALLPGADPDERGRTIDAAYRRADPASWRWERWLGWTAWK
jgi:hypothetical protein